MEAEVFVLLYGSYPGGVDLAGVVTDSEMAQRWAARSSSNRWRRAVINDPEIVRLLSVPALPDPSPAAAKP